MLIDKINIQFPLRIPETSISFIDARIEEMTANYLNDGLFILSNRNSYLTFFKKNWYKYLKPPSVETP